VNERRCDIQRVTQARAKNTSAGEPILVPFRNFEQSKLFIRRGGLTLVAAGPGTGKSALVQAITQRGDGAGRTNSVFYFSADSSAWDLYTRAAAIATGRTTDDIEDELDTAGSARLNAVVNDATKHMMMDFSSAPTDEYVLNQLKAYAELHGRWPDVIVMDNLKDLVVGDGEDEFRALEDACVFLKQLASDTNAAVIALHHVTGQLEDGFSQIPLSGLRGKVSKTPAMVLTLHKGPINPVSPAQQLRVSITKQRGGLADASGSYYVPLAMDLSRMAFDGG
jgi:replicative DNA helicase